MTSDEFAQKIKTKYPQYEKIDNASLTEKMISKFPEYASQVDTRTSSAGQPIYQPTDQITPWGASKESLSQPVPGLEQIGKFSSETLPGAIAEKSGQLGARVASSGVPGAGMAGEAIKDAGMATGTALGTAGEMIPRKVGDVALQALAGPLMEGAGATIKAAGKATAPAREFAGKIGTALLARDIGVAEPFIENMKKNPAALKDLSNDMTVVQAHAKTISDIMKRGVDRLGQSLNTIEDHYMGVKMADPGSLKTISLGEMDDISKNFIDKIKNRGTEGIKDAYSEMKTITGDEASTINKYVGRLEKLVSSKGETGVSSPGLKKEPNVIDLLRLKRELGNDIAWTKDEAVAKKIGTQANGLLQGLYKELQGKIEKLAPELKEANSQYANARKQYDILQRNVFGGDEAQAYQRVKLRIQRGIAPESLIERAAQINSQTEGAMKALIDKVSAQQFAPYVRKGISGGAIGVGAGAGAALAMGGHGIYPLMADLFAAVASSPRMAAAGIRGEAAASSAISDAVAKMVAQGKANPMLLRAIAQGAANEHHKKD